MPIAELRILVLEDTQCNALQWHVCSRKPWQRYQFLNLKDISCRIRLEFNITNTMMHGGHPHHIMLMHWAIWLHWAHSRGNLNCELNLKKSQIFQHFLDCFWLPPKWPTWSAILFKPVTTCHIWMIPHSTKARWHCRRTLHRAKCTTWTQVNKVNYIKAHYVLLCIVE